MTPAITLEELLAWDDETSKIWKAHFDANPALLELPCGIDGAANVMEFVGHIWAGELRWGQRIAGLPPLAKEDVPAGPLAALFDLHIKAATIFRTLLDDPTLKWDEKMTLDFPWLPPNMRSSSRRKVATHALFHGQRHWAQLATLIRTAGFPSGFEGDILFSSALA